MSDDDDPFADLESMLEASSGSDPGGGSDDGMVDDFAALEAMLGTEGPVATDAIAVHFDSDAESEDDAEAHLAGVEAQVRSQNVRNQPLPHYAG